MQNTTVTRRDIVEAIHREVGLSSSECSDIFEGLLAAIADNLDINSPVKISGFGSFSVRQKNHRTGRNPRTREAVPIPPRKVLKFSASQTLKQLINQPADLAQQPSNVRFWG